MTNERRLQILNENYKGSDQAISLLDYINLESESDPRFFNWFFGTEADNIQDFGMGMTAEQSEEFNNFLAEIAG